MLIKSGGNLTIRTFGGLGLGGDFDDDTYRRRSNDSWVPYDEYIAIECIVAPNQLYQLLTDVAQVATVTAQLTLVGYQYLQGGLRLVREDGSCIDFSGKAMLDNLLNKSKDILDLDFLHASEGYRSEAYWPGASSGITIGYGVDIGQQSETGLIKWGVPQSIIDKIKDYLGVTGEAADTILSGLKDKTLGLSDSEIKQLSDIVKKQTTENIINKYKQHLALVISEKDNGIYDAMNKGIEKATGKYIGFINADDFYNEGALCHAIEIMKANEYDIIYGNMFMVDVETLEVKGVRRPKHWKLNIDMNLSHPATFV
ncbi:TPA: glycosyltransferase, partial [Salmonella enterica subsp. enterica serovar Hvittingfoss]|nr:glycosyltransferase [Salmonella enterica subsp. enterica serovar Hvittingfoss]